MWWYRLNEFEQAFIIVVGIIGSSSIISGIIWLIMFS